MQSMQIVALASGNPFTGALSMLLFSLGTVPLMLGLGSIVSALGKKFTQKVMTVGAVLVVVLGLAMLSQGGSLSGFLPPDLLLPIIIALSVIGVIASLPFKASAHKTVSIVVALGVAVVALTTWTMLSDSLSGNTGNSSAIADSVQVVDGKQVINSTLSSGRYPNITVQVGTPVKWVIDAPKGSINGCNNRMFINEYGIQYSFKTGENVIEFTPTKTGAVRYNCWMGMIRGTINVVDNVEAAYTSAYAANDTESIYEYDGFFASEPIPADVTIPTENLAIAEFGTIDIGDGNEYEIQRVSIDLTDDGYGPAVIVVQAGIDVEWTINNASTTASNSTILVPLYYTALGLEVGENPLFLFPTEDFDFSNGDNSFYGYIKVVDDLTSIDEAAIKSEVASYRTLIYPPETFDGGGSGAPSCH
ncbi:hypothetical protein AGMMS49992_15190 [Clostridia bacterium]|nr:hypothetical protein AGMMS49992_15190 [Clostridia bacterium]